MVSRDELKLDTMWGEAVERLGIMEAHYQERWHVLSQRNVGKKIVVNHMEKSVTRADVTEEELQMIKDFEKKYGYIVYYLIEDTGTWPDGCAFKRYTMPYVDRNEAGYAAEREECIGLCGTCPAYVVNMEEPECSEITEFVFRNMGGLIMNAS